MLTGDLSRHATLIRRSESARVDICSLSGLLGFPPLFLDPSGRRATVMGRPMLTRSSPSASV